MKSNQNKIELVSRCPECNSPDLTKDQYHAELVCNSCGYVIEDDFIDYGPDWRAYTPEDNEKKSHIGSPMSPLIHDKGLSTTIGWSNRDSYGKKIPSKNKSQVYRLRKWQKITSMRNSKDKNLIHALHTLDRIASGLDLPKPVREHAAIIYREAIKKNIIRGRTTEGIVAGCIYAACRKYNIPRTLDEIENKTNVTRKQIGRGYRHLSRSLDLKLKPTSPYDYISRYCNDLNLSCDTRSIAIEILDKANEINLFNGKGPIGMAAAALYIASKLNDEPRTQKQIADIANITQVTIRNRYKELIDELNIELDT